MPAWTCNIIIIAIYRMFSVVSWSLNYSYNFSYTLLAVHVLIISHLFVLNLKYGYKLNLYKIEQEIIDVFIARVYIYRACQHKYTLCSYNMYR